MGRRSLAETAIVSRLADYGWVPPTLRVQRAAFPGCTPAKDSEGKGRGGIVFDLERVDERSSILISYAFGLKATCQDRPSSIAVTTGTESHCEGVLAACKAGLDVPIVVVHIEGSRWDDETLVGFDTLAATCVRFGAMLRKHGIVERVSGQGKGRGAAAPVAYGRKGQKSNGKVYTYVTLQANLAGCGAEWVTLHSFAELERYVSEHAEGIPL